MKEKWLKFLEEKGISQEQWKDKSGEEMSELHNEFQDINRKEIETKIEEKASKEDIQTLKEELMKHHNDFANENLAVLKDAVKQHGLLLKKLTDEEKEELQNAESVYKSIEKNLEAIGGLREKGGKLRFKAPADMLISTNVSGGNVPVEQRLGGLNIIPSRRIRLMDVVQRGVATSNVISWVYQANKDGAAGGTAEGALKNQIDFDLVVDSETVKKRTAFIKISDEMKGDIDFMTSEVNNELSRELLKDVENQVYQGDGTGTNLNGIRTVASPFTAGTFALSIDNANIVDVLRVASNQIKIAEHDGPTAIFMHPSDVTFLKTQKVGSTDERYINQLQEIAGNLSMDGIPIIETTLVTQDEYLIGDFTLSTVWDRGSVDIEMGLDGDDFTKNMMTIRAEWRGLVIVKNNDRTAFVEGTFSTDQAALETP